MGSFAAGLAVSKFPYNMEVLDTTTGLRDFFSAIFFVALGALVSIPSASGFLIALGLIFASLFLKPAVLILTMRWQQFDSRTSYMAALHMDQMSEFALIIAIQAFVAGSMLPTVFHGIIFAAIVTMVVSSYTSAYADSIYTALSVAGLIDKEWEIKDHSIPDDLSDHIIVCGFDVQGREIVQKLEELDASYVVIENDPAKIIELRQEGRNYVFGDLHIDTVWKRARLDTASLIVSTVPYHSVNDHLLSMECDADIIARASSRREADVLLERCLYVIYPDLLASEKLREHIHGVLNSADYRKRLRQRSRKELR